MEWHNLNAALVVWPSCISWQIERHESDSSTKHLNVRIRVLRQNVCSIERPVSFALVSISSLFIIRCKYLNAEQETVHLTIRTKFKRFVVQQAFVHLITSKKHLHFYSIYCALSFINTTTFITNTYEHMWENMNSHTPTHTHTHTQRDRKVNEKICIFYRSLVVAIIFCWCWLELYNSMLLFDFSVCVLLVW